MRITKVAVALSVINCAVAAFAGEFSWTGAGEPNADGTRNWTDPANWSGTGYPQSSGDSATFTSTAEVALPSAALEIGVLLVASDAHLTLKNGTISFTATGVTSYDKMQSTVGARGCLTLCNVAATARGTYMPILYSEDSRLELLAGTTLSFTGMWLCSGTRASVYVDASTVDGYSQIIFGFRGGAHSVGLNNATIGTGMLAFQKVGCALAVTNSTVTVDGRRSQDGYFYAATSDGSGYFNLDVVGNQSQITAKSLYAQVNSGWAHYVRYHFAYANGDAPALAFSETFNIGHRSYISVELPAGSLPTGGWNALVTAGKGITDQQSRWQLPQYQAFGTGVEALSVDCATPGKVSFKTENASVNPVAALVGEFPETKTSRGFAFRVSDKGKGAASVSATATVYADSSKSVQIASKTVADQLVDIGSDIRFSFDSLTYQTDYYLEIVVFNDSSGTQTLGKSFRIDCEPLVGNDFCWRGWGDGKRWDAPANWGLIDAYPSQPSHRVTIPSGASAVFDLSELSVSVGALSVEGGATFDLQDGTLAVGALSLLDENAKLRFSGDDAHVTAGTYSDVAGAVTSFCYANEEAPALTVTSGAYAPNAAACIEVTLPAEYEAGATVWLVSCPNAITPPAGWLEESVIRTIPDGVSGFVVQQGSPNRLLMQLKSDDPTPAAVAQACVTLSKSSLRTALVVTDKGVGATTVSVGVALYADSAKTEKLGEQQLAKDVTDISNPFEVTFAGLEPNVGYYAEYTVANDVEGVLVLPSTVTATVPRHQADAPYSWCGWGDGTSWCDSYNWGVCDNAPTNLGDNVTLAAGTYDLDLGGKEIEIRYGNVGTKGLVVLADNATLTLRNGTLRPYNLKIGDYCTLKLQATTLWLPGNFLHDGSQGKSGFTLEMYDGSSISGDCTGVPRGSAAVSRFFVKDSAYEGRNQFYVPWYNGSNRGIAGFAGATVFGGMGQFATQSSSVFAATNTTMTFGDVSQPTAAHNLKGSRAELVGSTTMTAFGGVFSVTPQVLALVPTATGAPKLAYSSNGGTMAPTLLSLDLTTWKGGDWTIAESPVAVAWPAGWQVGTGTLQEAVAAGAVTVVGIRRKLKKFAFVEETTGTGEELRHMLILREQPVCGLTVIIK